jgi:hypothetical protein
MKAAIVVAAIVLAGCAESTLVVRVAEGGAAGDAMFGGAKVGSCSVSTTDQAPAGTILMEYSGDKCTVRYETGAGVE